MCCRTYLRLKRLEFELTVAEVELTLKYKGMIRFCVQCGCGDDD